MKPLISMLLVLSAALLLYPAIAPNTARANELIANNSSSAACSNTDSTCFTTIQAAIDEAYYLNSLATGTVYSVRVEPGTYTEALDLKGITVQGRETARTILSGGGSGTLVTASTSSISSISNVTFADASIGINASNNTASFDIKNNIFLRISTAVVLQNSSNTNVANNVFYGNGTAISTDADRVITSNIFMLNSGSAISTSASSASNITYNDFFSNAADGVAWDTITNINLDPMFVDTSSSTPDFHLQTGSPCISSGAGSVDMGAYGGSGADTIPFLVSGVTGSLDTTTNIISVEWNANNSYQTTGYHVYYGTTSGVYTGTGATEGNSPLNVSNAATTFTTLSGLTSSASATPSIPTITSVTPLNESLEVSWDAVEGATGYRLYYDIDDGTSSPPTTLKEEGTNTSDTLTGLTNDVKYKIAVSAYSQPTYYLAVTALNTTSAGISSPGIAHESAYSDEVTVSVGDKRESDQSAFMIEFPEALVAYPNLTSQGPRCFIATAAFGYYSAPEVQALREFRDRYLLTNSPGSAFVRWYYEHGPIAAAYLDAHPVYKPIVRAVLMPAVGTALFMTKTSIFVKAVTAVLFFLMIALIAVLRSSRKNLSGSGGSL
jgi:hypothetical protein